MHFFVFTRLLGAARQRNEHEVFRAGENILIVSLGRVENFCVLYTRI